MNGRTFWVLATLALIAFWGTVCSGAFLLVDVLL